MGAEESGPLDSRGWELISFARLRMQGFDFDPPTTENVGHRSGFVEDAFVIAFVVGMTSLGQNFLLALRRVLLLVWQPRPRRRALAV